MIVRIRIEAATILCVVNRILIKEKRVSCIYFDSLSSKPLKEKNVLFLYKKMYSFVSV